MLGARPCRSCSLCRVCRRKYSNDRLFLHIGFIAKDSRSKWASHAHAAEREGQVEITYWRGGTRSDVHRHGLRWDHVDIRTWKREDTYMGNSKRPIQSDITWLFLTRHEPDHATSHRMAQSENATHEITASSQTSLRKYFLCRIWRRWCWRRALTLHHYRFFPGFSPFISRLHHGWCCFPGSSHSPLLPNLLARRRPHRFCYLWTTLRDASIAARLTQP